MNKEEIKAELKARGWTYAMLADKLGMSEGRIKTIMSSKEELKKTLQNHIELLFASPSSAVLVYRIDLTTDEVSELCGSREFPDTEKGRADLAKAVEAVLHHNMEHLAALGKKCNWSDKEKAWLGIPTAQDVPFNPLSIKGMVASIFNGPFS